jgi:LPPG:FO 2-phospho-L-lactate transferase
MYVALAGGVGGARMAYGLSRALSAKDLLVAVNTGDDFRHMGLAISPDLDTVAYTLAELDDQERGWGRSDETWHFMRALAKLGGPAWFQLGDADLALHVTRTRLMAEGRPLGEITRTLNGAMGISCRVVPMTDDAVATIVHSDAGPLEFQDYFVRQRCEPVALGFEYRGAAEARPHAELMQAMASESLDGIILCPSNPWLSIGPMLAMPDLRAALDGASAPVVAVSPIVGGRAVKGPAAKLMAELGVEVSALAVARHYQGLADAFVIDHADAALKGDIEALGMQVLVTETIMRSRADRERLAREILGRPWR